MFQVLSGRDFAKDHGMATQMANYTYVLVPRDDPGNIVLVDPCYDIDGVVSIGKAIGGANAEITQALFTHHHPDHVGGRFGGVQLQGIREVLQLPTAPCCGVGALDLGTTARRCGVDPARITPLHDGDTRALGKHATLVVLHTPGHTEGSICFQLVSTHPDAQEGVSALFTGDTLFIGSCGKWQDTRGLRLLVMSLDRLAALPSNTVVLPGHNYSHVTTSTIGAERETNDIMMQALDAAPKLRKLAEEHPEILSTGGVTCGDAGRRQSSAGDVRELQAYLIHARFANDVADIGDSGATCVVCPSTENKCHI